jgi:DNA-binding transcriptional regulator LsrR (DeoR family)
VKAIIKLDYLREKLTAKNISAITGLHRDIVKKGLDQFQALGIITLKADDHGEYEWELACRPLKDIVMRLDPPDLENNLDIEI